MKKHPFLVIVALAAILICAGCSSETPLPTPTALPVRTSTPGIPPVPSSTPTAGNTPTPTVLPSPTSLPPSTASPTVLLPSATLAAFTPTGTAVPSATPSPKTCSDIAAFSEDITIPDGTLLRAGDTFTKTWRVRNAGTCTWDGYGVVYAGGEAMNSAMSTPLQQTEPGAYVDISLRLQAPLRGGAYTGYWQFMDAAGQTFGLGFEGIGLLWIQINVDYSAATPTPASAGGGSGSCPYTRNTEYESQILTLINEARAQNGLNPLTWDDRLAAAALVHSADMACNDFVEHNGSDGSTVYDRVAAQGFANSSSARENIYVGNPAFGGDAQGAFEWWMNSEIHRKTILNPNLTVAGVAYVFYEDSTYGGYYTINFGRP